MPLSNGTSLPIPRDSEINVAAESKPEMKPINLNEINSDDANFMSMDMLSPVEDENRKANIIN